MGTVEGVRPRPFISGRANVAVVESADTWKRNDRTRLRRLHFTLDWRVPFQRTLGAPQVADQLAHLECDLRSSVLLARLAAPIEPEALAVPAGDGLGLNDYEHRFPSRPEHLRDRLLFAVS